MISGPDPLRIEAVTWRSHGYAEEWHPRWSGGEGLRSERANPTDLWAVRDNAQRNSHLAPTRNYNSGPMPFGRSIRLAVLAALVAATAAASGLDDVRAALEKTGPAQPVRVRVEGRSTSVQKNKREEKVSAPIVVEHGPEGLRLTWDRGQVERAQEVPRGSSPEQKAAREMAALSASDALEIVDGARALRRMIAGATLLSEKEGALDGQPARVLVVRPVSEMTGEERKEFKTFEETLTLTVGPDGIPRLAEHSVTLKMSKLLISMTASQKETKRYAPVAGRLIVTSSDESSSSSALGQTGEHHTVRTVVPF